MRSTYMPITCITLSLQDWSPRGNIEFHRPIEGEGEKGDKGVRLRVVVVVVVVTVFFVNGDGNGGDVNIDGEEEKGET